MNNLVYYPGFEVQDNNWLKFALLYIDKLHPIIPYSGDDSLSHNFNILSSETDLLEKYRPQYIEQTMATQKALTIIEKILRYPESFCRIFRGTNFLGYWRNPISHKYLLYRDKFTHDWDRFCINEGLATPSHLGILVPKQLGHLYMTVLANFIADSNGISAITDYSSLDNFNMISSNYDAKENKKIKLAKSSISLSLPANIKEIPLHRIVEFRNKSDFRRKLTAFQTELNNYLTNVENGNSSMEFVLSFNDCWNDYSGDLKKLGIGSMSFGLGVWIALNNPESTFIEYINSIVVAGAVLSVNSIVDINDTYHRTESKRNARKYFASLRKIKIS